MTNYPIIGILLGCFAVLATWIGITLSSPIEVVSSSVPAVHRTLPVDEAYRVPPIILPWDAVESLGDHTEGGKSDEPVCAVLEE